MLGELEQIANKVRKISQKESYNVNKDDFENLKKGIQNILHVECEVRGGLDGEASEFQEKYGVYVFFLGEKCLKVGKVGPKSKARWEYQHYRLGAAQSSLPNSIKNDKNFLSDFESEIKDKEEFDKLFSKETSPSQPNQSEDEKAELEAIHQELARQIQDLKGEIKPDTVTGIRDWIKKHCIRLEFILTSTAGDTAESKRKVAFATNFLEAFLQWQLEPRYEGRQISL